MFHFSRKDHEFQERCNLGPVSINPLSTSTRIRGMSEADQFLIICCVKVAYVVGVKSPCSFFVKRSYYPPLRNKPISVVVVFWSQHPGCKNVDKEAQVSH